MRVAKHLALYTQYTREFDSQKWRDQSFILRESHWVMREKKPDQLRPARLLRDTQNNEPLI